VILGPARVIEAGVVVKRFVKEVGVVAFNFKCVYG